MTEEETLFFCGIDWDEVLNLFPTLEYDFEFQEIKKHEN
tara:strand:- start:479 stop:595 length:117 start_codon:yes stop_codon:yes gene_type:complete